MYGVLMSVGLTEQFWGDTVNGQGLKTPEVNKLLERVNYQNENWINVARVFIMGLEPHNKLLLLSVLSLKTKAKLPHCLDCINLIVS